MRMCSRRKIILAVLLLAAAAAAPRTSVAQDEPENPSGKVRDLTGKNLSTAELIQTLAPKHGPKTRGIAPVEPAKPQCEMYGRQLSRGIKLKADTRTDMAAIHVPFAVNSSELTPVATENLDKLAAALKSPELASYCFEIAGHTDASGGDEYNKELSQRRAESAVQYLEKQGVPADRLVAVGCGKREPLADNATEEGRQKNRRVQIANLGTGPAKGDGAQ